MAQPSVPSASESDSKKTGYYPGEDSWSKWCNIFGILSGQMTDEGKQQFKLAKDIRNEAADVKRCERYLDFLFKYSPTIRFMRENIQQLHGDVNETNIRCKRCTTRQGGGFSPEYGIMICANEMRDQGHFEDTLAHEMIHAYDHLRFKVNWSADLRHAACAEIRASALSGECRWTREFFTRKQRNITQQFQECVRRRAALSLMDRPTCKDSAHAEKLVNEVWDSCFADTRPFDEIYR